MDRFIKANGTDFVLVRMWIKNMNLNKTICRLTLEGTFKGKFEGNLKVNNKQWILA